MPPKKEIKKVTDAPKFDYPVNECKFTITVDLEHLNGQNIKVKYDWFTQAS